MAGRDKGDAAIAAFKHSHDVNVLLLPVRSGANGLNLTEAQHVLLTEPLFSSAVEAQARHTFQITQPS